MRQSTLERMLTLALTRGDRVAAIGLAQRLWHAGDVRRMAVLTMHVDAASLSYPRAYALYALRESEDHYCAS